MEQRRGQEQICRASGKDRLWGCVYAGEGKVSRVQPVHSGLDRCVFSAFEAAKTTDRLGKHCLVHYNGKATASIAPCAESTMYIHTTYISVSYPSFGGILSKQYLGNNPAINDTYISRGAFGKTSSPGIIFLRPKSPTYILTRNDDIVLYPEMSVKVSSF